MASQIAHLRMKEPRKLENKETFQSLQQWKMQFRQYVKQDDHYKTFLASDTVWNPQATNYGFEVETQGLKRSARALMDDCCDLLHTLATFLPHGYLTDKIVSTTTSFSNAFEVIQEHYGLLPTQESFMDLESFNKQASESYRQFHERLLAHVRLHLHRVANVTVDGITVPVEGDKITVSHGDLVTLTWLRKIHPELINIVKTEYSLELRDNKPLFSLVPRISVNIDNLLTKYDKLGSVNLVQQDDKEEKKHVVVNRTFMRKREKNREPSTPFCPGCFRLNKSSNSQLHYQHLASQCPRKLL